DPHGVEADPEAAGCPGLEGGRHATAARADEHELVVVETRRRGHGRGAGQGAWISDAAWKSEISPRALGGSSVLGRSTAAAVRSVGRIARFTWSRSLQKAQISPVVVCPHRTHSMSTTGSRSWNSPRALSRKP